MSFFSLSRTWGKISLRGHYCSSLTVLQHSFLAELCKRALRALYQNFSTWLLTWLLASHLTMSITFHPSQNLLPLPEDLFIISYYHTALRLRPHPTHHQHVCNNFSYSLKSQKPGAAGESDTQSSNSCFGPYEEREVLLLNFALKWVGKSLLASLLLTRTPPGHTTTSQGPVRWPSASAPCHITGHEVVLSLWRTKYLTNVCEVPNRFQFPSWRTVLDATAKFNNNKGRSAFLHLCWGTIS